MRIPTSKRALLAAVLLTFPLLGKAAQPDSSPRADALPLTTLAKPPELPRKSVDTAMPQLTGRTITVGARDHLQAAINQARRGDTIRVDFRGEWPAIVLPEKPGSGWIQIESTALDMLPGAGERVTEEDARHMPTIFNIVTGTPRPALNTQECASHYRIIGLRLKSRPLEKPGHNKMLMLGRGDCKIPGRPARPHYHRSLHRGRLAG